MLTTTQVAKKLKRPVRTIAHVAAEHGIGITPSSRLRLFSDDDVARLRQVLKERKRGRPRLES